MNSSPTVTGCVFRENWAGAGGGMCNRDFSSPVITGCAFSENAAFFDGAGMYIDSSNPLLSHCAFSANLAFSRGDGLFVSAGAPMVENCTFHGGAAFLSGGGIHLAKSNPTLINSILWNDMPDEIYIDGSVPAVTYSCVQGGCPGAGNIQQDPLFVDPDQGDLHLTKLSPCIYRGTGTGFMGTIDMGAYEYVGTHLLEEDLFSLSEATGGAVAFHLHAGAVNGNRQYVLLGGITGTAPGIPLPGGSAVLPVNWDLFTNLVIGLLNTPSFSNFAVGLDASGDAAAKLVSKGPLPPGAVGVILRFAYGLQEPWNLASNPVGIEIVP